MITDNKILKIEKLEDTGVLQEVRYDIEITDNTGQKHVHGIVIDAATYNAFPDQASIQAHLKQRINDVYTAWDATRKGAVTGPSTQQKNKKNVDPMTEIGVTKIKLT